MRSHAGAVALIRAGFTDCVGVMIAGASEPAPQLLKAMLAPAGGEATLLFGEGRASVLDAAWINSTAAHALDLDDVRDGVRDLCGQFPPEYFRALDQQRGYPEAFVDALTTARWLAALIAQEYGGSGLGLTEASVIMEEVNRAGGNSGACHGQMYNIAISNCTCLR